MKRIIPLILISFFSLQFINASEYNIFDFGANGDAKTLNTEAINKAVKECNLMGGGTVLVPPGTFVTGTIILLSNVNLKLEPGAVIIGSKDTIDYSLMKNALFSEGYNRNGVIYAHEATNISITGLGEINGNGTHFMNGIDKPHMGGGDFDRKYIRQGQEFMKQGTIYDDGPVSYNFRPGMMIVFELCENIQIKGVTLKDSPEWTVRIADSNNINIDGISILNNVLVPNSDGIHCTNSRNIRISNCNIVAGDDAIIVTGFSNLPVPSDPEYIAPKIGNKTGYAENVTVTNCILASRSACIRIGYGHHPIRNLVFSNLVMYDSNRGIGIFARDESSIENVLFSNIIIQNRLHSGHWWGKGEPIHISSIPETPNGKIGRIKNISFSDISANSETGIVIYGNTKNLIQDITFNKIQLTIHPGKYTDSYGGNFDLRPAFSPELSVFKHDISGLYAEQVDALSIQDFKLKWEGELPDFFTNGIECKDVKDLYIKNFQGGANPGAKAAERIKTENTNSLMRDK